MPARAWSPSLPLTRFLSLSYQVPKDFPRGSGGTNRDFLLGMKPAKAVSRTNVCPSNPRRKELPAALACTVLPMLQWYSCCLMAMWGMQKSITGLLHRWKQNLFSKNIFEAIKLSKNSLDTHVLRMMFYPFEDYQHNCSGCLMNMSLCGTGNKITPQVSLCI